jgi:hypothetical protein
MYSICAFEFTVTRSELGFGAMESDKSDSASCRDGFKREGSAPIHL